MPDVLLTTYLVMGALHVLAVLWNHDMWDLTPWQLALAAAVVFVGWPVLWFAGIALMGEEDNDA
jgi:hypothetical protein